MQKSDKAQTAKSTHRRVETSTTLNRRYVKRLTRKIDGISVKNKINVKNETDVQVRRQAQNTKITRFSSPMAKKEVRREVLRPAKAHPTQILVNQCLRERKQQIEKQQVKKLSAQELKEQAIKKALAAAAANKNQLAEVATSETPKKVGKIRFGFKRVVLALSCAAAAVFAIVYFINLNMPDIQFRAAAAQLNATYPNYLPYNYSPSEIASENNIITLSFENHNSKEKFQIVEEKSSWDSNSLLNNFVKSDFGDSYTTIREQGLTIYIGENKAAWVNGGVVYKLNILKGSLSKKQISSIAVSF